MTSHQIDEVLERVRTWPAKEREEAALLLLALEQRRLGTYEPAPDELDDIEMGLLEGERGELTSNEEMRALFDRYRS